MSDLRVAEQGSEEWLQERLGYCTASNFSSVLAKGEGVSRKKYLRRVVAERLTKKSLANYSNANMERGTEQEPYARMNYEAATFNFVNETGFVKHETLLAGASPDGLIEGAGGIEIKSVIPTVQIETIEKGGCPPTHKAQIQGCMWITKREWWDFVSYSPDMPGLLKLYIFRVSRDDDYISELEKSVQEFLEEVDCLYLKLMNQGNTRWKFGRRPGSSSTAKRGCGG